jgi:hypothetical protein
MECLRGTAKPCPGTRKMAKPLPGVMSMLWEKHNAWEKLMEALGERNKWRDKNFREDTGEPDDADYPEKHTISHLQRDFQQLAEHVDRWLPQGKRNLQDWIGLDQPMKAERWR